MATLKIRLKSHKMPPFRLVRLDIRRLRDENVADEYKRELAKRLSELNDSDDLEKLWTYFKTQILTVSESCLRGTPGMSKSFLTKETLNTIGKSPKGRLEGKTGQYLKLKREAVHAMRKD